MDLYEANLNVDGLMKRLKAENLMMFPLLLSVLRRIVSELESGGAAYAFFYTQAAECGGYVWVRGKGDSWEEIYCSCAENFLNPDVSLPQKGEKCFYVSCAAALGEAEHFDRNGLYFSLGKMFEKNGSFYIPLTIKGSALPDVMFDRLQFLCREARVEEG